jgi:hypothetical protein
MLGAFGVYFFYIAPLLHVARDFWFVSATFFPSDRPNDWRPWLGAMGCLNFCGLLLCGIVQRHFTNRDSAPRRRASYEIDLHALKLYGSLLLGVSFIAQAYVYSRFGGIGGFMEAYDSVIAGRGATFQGLGWIMCIGESFPVLLLIVWTARLRAYSQKWSYLRTTAALTVLFFLIVIFGGLRGSRGNTVYAVLYAIGIIHLTLRRLSWRTLAVIGTVLLVFMYVYGFYKVSQQTFLSAVGSQEELRLLGEKTGRNLDAVLLGDIERSDMQAFMLFRLADDASNVEYALGRTYLDSALNFIPYAIFPYRPPGKVKYGTDLCYGLGTYVDGGFGSTKIYGLAGEAMLNWGLLGVLPAFIAFGCLTGKLQMLISHLGPSDSRRYVAPIMSIACVVTLSSDFDNLLYVLLRQALMPVLLIWLCSTRYSAKPEGASLRLTQ